MNDAFISLMYHNLQPAAGRAPDAAALSPSIRSYFITDLAFDEQLSVLAEHAGVMSYEEVCGLYSGGSRVAADRRPRVHLTFDDGWQGCVELGAPLLAARGWQATLFVTTNLIGQAGFVSEADLRRIDGGAFVIGSHSQSHCFLCELPDEVIREELQTSRQRLEDILGRRVDALSIPNGAVDRRVIRIAIEVGYACVFTSEPRLNTRRRGPSRIGRVAIRNSTTTGEVAAFAQGRLLKQRCRQQMLALPKRLLGPANYRALRRALLGEGRGEQEMHDLASNGRA